MNYLDIHQLKCDKNNKDEDTRLNKSQNNDIASREFQIPILDVSSFIFFDCRLGEDGCYADH